MERLENAKNLVIGTAKQIGIFEQSSSDEPNTKVPENAEESSDNVPKEEQGVSSKRELIANAKNMVKGTVKGTVKQIDETINDGKLRLKKPIITTINRGKEFIYKIAIFSLIAAVLFWTSVFMYGSFYYAFIPFVTHEAPLHVGFQPCVDSPQRCGFINASISMNMLSGSGNQDANSPVLMAGQPYTVVVALNMPESPQNLDLGMFMSCLQVVSSDKATKSGKEEIIRTSCKSSMIQYRSMQLRTIETLLLAPLYISGHLVERQDVYIEFFDDFQDNSFNPATQINFEIQSRFAEVYDARLLIHARFVGIRYFMYYYPVTSAIVGIAFNFNVLVMVVLLSWLRFFAPSNYTEEKEEEQKIEELDRSTKSATSDAREGIEDENNRTESKRYGIDLDVLNSDDNFQVDSEEDKTRNKKDL